MSDQDNGFTREEFIDQMAHSYLQARKAYGVTFAGCYEDAQRYVERAEKTCEAQGRPIVWKEETKS